MFEIIYIYTYSKFLQVQSYKFIPLVYQIASRMGSSKDGLGPHSFQVETLRSCGLFPVRILEFVFNKKLLDFAVCFGFSCEKNGRRPSIPYNLPGKMPFYCIKCV